MPWAAAAAAAAAVAGGAMQSHAAKKAAGEQGRNSERALLENQRQFELSREDITPWRTTGQQALRFLGAGLGFGDMGAVGFSERPPVPTMERAAADAARQLKEDIFYGRIDGPRDRFGRLQVNQINHDEEIRRRTAENFAADQRRFEQWNQMVGQATPGSGGGELLRKFTLEDFQNDPVTQASLQFGLDEGTKALSRMRRAQGTFNSGGTAKALTRFTTDYVGQQAGASRDRFVQDQANIYNRLSNAAGMGQTAAQNTAQLGANFATNAGNIMIGQGNARGAASIAQGNAIAGGLNSAGNAAQRAYMWNKVFGNQETTTTPTTTSPGSFVTDDYTWGGMA